MSIQAEHLSKCVLGAVFFAMLSVLLACSGGKATNPSNPEIAGATQVLSAGATITLGEDSGVLVPAGAIVTEPDGRTVKIKRSSDTVYVPVGSKVTVPLSATGTPRIKVTVTQ